MNPKPQKIGVAMLQWNHVEHTKRAVQDLICQSEKPAKIVICDNGSEHQCWQEIQLEVIDSGYTLTQDASKWEISLVRNSNNSGFAAGMNVAIRVLMETDCDWIWVLNNDVRINSEAIGNLRSSVSILPPGCYGTMISETDEPPLPGLLVYNKWMTTFRNVTLEGVQSALKSDDVYINGASMVIHKSVLETVGLLSEKTFLYFEELDYTRRLREKEFATGVISEVSIVHLAGGSSGKSSEESSRPAITMYHETWSTLAFNKEHHPVFFYLVLLLRTPARVLTLVLKARTREVPEVFSATVDFMRGFNRDKSPVKIEEQNYFSVSSH